MQVAEIEPQALEELEVPEVDTPAGDVQVIYGAGVQMLPLSGLQLGAARALLESILQVDPTAPVLVNGKPVKPAHHQIVKGDVLEFVHQAGEKGAVHGPAHRDQRRAGCL
jgi:hypothetical protein